MRTRRTVLAGVAATIALAGCSQQSSQPSEEQTTDSSTGEFSLDTVRVDGEEPSEYQAEFISGASPENAADEFNPLFEYTITGTNNNVETELHVTHTDETIPKEELNETRQGQTHPGAGQYQQNIPLPDPVIQMFTETPRNLQAALKATDTQTQQTETQTFEMNYGNSYAEQIVREAFSQGVVSHTSGLESVDVSDGEFYVRHSSNSEPGESEFDYGLSEIAGLYTGTIDETRTPWTLNIEVSLNNEETYNAEVGEDLALKYLNGDIRQGEFTTELITEELATSY